jgi:hypothetical protein
MVTLPFGAAGRDPDAVLAEFEAAGKIAVVHGQGGLAIAGSEVELADEVVSRVSDQVGAEISDEFVFAGCYALEPYRDYAVFEHQDLELPTQRLLHAPFRIA